MYFVCERECVVFVKYVGGVIGWWGGGGGADGPQPGRYEVYGKEHGIRGEYWGGFTRHNTLFRRVLGMDGAELGEEFITENHAIMMYNPMLEETAP